MPNYCCIYVLLDVQTLQIFQSGVGWAHSFGRSFIVRYILAILLPPFAILSCRKPFQFTLNLAVWLVSLMLTFAMGLGFIGWFFCAMHALIVVGQRDRTKQMDRLVGAIQSRGAAQAQSPAAVTPASEPTASSL
jgi:hypothetical protein